MTSSTPEVTAALCAYPGCEREPRAGEAGAGAKPKYCGLPDPVSGKPHTALTAFRRRQELALQGGGATEAEDLGRPVTMATARAAELRTGIRNDMATLTARLAELAVQLERAADPEAAAAQVEAVQAEAAEQVADARADVAREAQRRQQAEAGGAAVEADTQLTEALAAKAAAEDAAAAAGAELAARTAEHEAEQQRTR